MAKHYVTFGQTHIHHINGVTYDKDCVACFEASSPASGRQKAFDLFGSKFCYDYHGEQFSFEEMLSYFPRGVIEV